MKEGRITNAVVYSCELIYVGKTVSWAICLGSSREMLTPSWRHNPTTPQTQPASQWPPSAFHWGAGTPSDDKFLEKISLTRILVGANKTHLLSSRTWRPWWLRPSGWSHWIVQPPWSWPRHWNDCQGKSCSFLLEAHPILLTWWET